jgi:S-adenosylmethionine hydrolase
MNRTGIITLLTDFGLSDPYVAMMKGVILSISPDSRVVDITHDIRTGSIIQGAGVIQETYGFFPEGTIHLAVVDPGVGSKRRHIAVKADGHFFVGPDNGIFWPVIEMNEDAVIVDLNREEYFLSHITSTFHGRDVFAPVSAHLSTGKDLLEMGSVIEDPVRLDMPVPSKRTDYLYGQIMRVDHFGNLITNIRRDVLEEFLGQYDPVISVGNLEIKKLENIYSDADKGYPLALINSADMLEIAVNLGRASEYLNLNSGEEVGTMVKVGRYR